MLEYEIRQRIPKLDRQEAFVEDLWASASNIVKDYPRVAVVVDVDAKHRECLGA